MDTSARFSILNPTKKRTIPIKITTNINLQGICNLLKVLLLSELPGGAEGNPCQGIQPYFYEISDIYAGGGKNHHLVPFGPPQQLMGVLLRDPFDKNFHGLADTLLFIILGDFTLEVNQHAQAFILFLLRDLIFI